MNKETPQEQKRLSSNIERTGVEQFTCHYVYMFSTPQWLENVDSLEHLGISDNDVRKSVIEQLVESFRISLNAVVFGDPAVWQIEGNLEGKQGITVYND